MLQLDDIKDRHWHIQECSALTGYGLEESSRARPAPGLARGRDSRSLVSQVKNMGDARPE